jgi:hypothetical protein
MIKELQPELVPGGRRGKSTIVCRWCIAIANAFTTSHTDPIAVDAVPSTSASAAKSTTRPRRGKSAPSGRSKYHYPPCVDVRNTDPRSLLVSQRDADQETIKELAASVRGLVRFMREMGTHFGIDTSSLDAPSSLQSPSRVPSPSDSPAVALRGLSIRGGSRGSSANSSVKSAHSGLFIFPSLYTILIIHRSGAWTSDRQCSEWVRTDRGEEACRSLVITISCCLSPVSFVYEM